VKGRTTRRCEPIRCTRGHPAGGCMWAAAGDNGRDPWEDHSLAIVLTRGVCMQRRAQHPITIMMMMSVQLQLTGVPRLYVGTAGWTPWSIFQSRTNPSANFSWIWSCSMFSSKTTIYQAKWTAGIQSPVHWKPNIDFQSRKHWGLCSKSRFFSQLEINVLLSMNRTLNFGIHEYCA